MRHGAGSRATAGHQKSSPAPRNSACSRSWISGSSSAASNSGEKWLPHITAANTTQATTGKARTRMTRPWRTGRIQRRRVAGDADPQHQGDRRGQRDERRGDQRQQHVLDHVDREQGRVVAVDARQQGEGERCHPGHERHGPAPWHGIVRMGGVDPPDGPPPPAAGRPRCRASGAARTSSRGGSTRRSAGRSGQDRGRRPVRPPRRGSRGPAMDAVGRGRGRRIQRIVPCRATGGIRGAARGPRRTARDAVAPGIMAPSGPRAGLTATR